MKITKDNYFLFSGGEVHCKDIPKETPSPIYLFDYTMNGLMALAQHKQVWDQNQDQRLRIHDLIIPYFPYARQDRWINVGESFSLKIYCDMLNSMKFNTVTIWDPHSDVTPALVNNCLTVSQCNLAKRILPQELFDDPNVMFVSPDAGAYKKLSKLMTNDYRIVLGTKIRSSKGEIIKTDVYSPVDLKGKTCVIVDDICDGGRTFIELAKVLKHKGAGKIILYITHGIFSNGFEELHKYIDAIYTTDSFSAVPAISNYVFRHGLLP